MQSGCDVCPSVLLSVSHLATPPDITSDKLQERVQKDSSAPALYKKIMHSLTCRVVSANPSTASVNLHLVCLCIFVLGDCE